jgi:signal peptidase I
LKAEPVTETVTVARKKKKAGHVAEQKPKETAVEFLSSMAAALATGLFIITFVVQTFAIPSSSMENALLVGDHLFVNRIQFAPRVHGWGRSFPTATFVTETLWCFFPPKFQDSTW